MGNIVTVWSAINMHEVVTALKIELGCPRFEDEAFFSEDVPAFVVRTANIKTEKQLSSEQCRKSVAGSGEVRTLRSFRDGHRVT